MVAKALRNSKRSQNSMPRLPTLVHLCALESLFRTGSARGAATDQAMTVACISQRLAALERELGQSLVTRSETDARRFAFTKEGSGLAVFLQRWLEDLYRNIPAEARFAPSTP